MVTDVIDDDPGTWLRAEFPGKNEYRHFVDPQDKRGCFVGESRLMRTRPLLVEPDYIVMPATVSVPGREGQYICPFAVLLFPAGRHVVDFEELPNDWTASQRHAYRSLREMGYTIDNTSVNHTQRGGRSFIGNEPLHYHEWIWSRPDYYRDGLISANVGPVTLLTRVLAYRSSAPF